MLPARAQRTVRDLGARETQHPIVMFHQFTIPGRIGDELARPEVKLIAVAFNQDAHAVVRRGPDGKIRADAPPGKRQRRLRNKVKCVDEVDLVRVCSH